MQTLELAPATDHPSFYVEEMVWEQYIYADCSYWTPANSLGAYNRLSFGIKPSQTVLVKVPVCLLETEGDIIKKIRRSLDLKFSGGNHELDH